VNLHLAGTCAIPSGSSGEYVATGDYDPPAQNHSALLATDVPGQTIDGIPSGVESLSLTAVPPDSSHWQGVTLVAPTGSVDMLLLPAAAACSPVTPVGFVDAMTFGSVSWATLLASGPPSKTGFSHPSFAVDLTQGTVVQTAHPMSVTRTAAAFAALGDGRAIVTGGLSVGVVQDTAEVFDASDDDFEPNTFSMTTARAAHAAVTLGNGNVFLVGGISGQPVAPTELVTCDPDCRATESSTPPLAVPRIDPVALRLADGTVLVGGGFADASATQPVELVEFFSADASQPLSGPAVSVAADAPNAFVALEGGGALYVNGAASNNVYFVTPNAALSIGTVAIAGDAKLFPRAGGGALLWNGAAWLAFDPWTASFSPVPNAPSTGPAVDSPYLAPDPGMRAWVNEDGSVSLWRDDVRNAFSSDDAFLVSDTSLLAPDNVPGPGFDPTLGLTLGTGESAFVSDSRYLDVDVSVASSGPSPVIVVLRAPTGDIEVGGKDCPFDPSATISAVHVVRRGTTITLSTNGGAFSTCAAIDASARVAVGIRGSGTQSRALALHVARLAR